MLPNDCDKPVNLREADSAIANTSEKLLYLLTRVSCGVVGGALLAALYFSGGGRAGRSDADCPVLVGSRCSAACGLSLALSLVCRTFLLTTTVCVCGVCLWN